MQRQAVIDIFKLEFNPISEKFIVIDNSVLEAPDSKAEHVRTSDMKENIRRITLEQARKLKSLSNSKKFNELTEEDIDKIISEDPDLYQLTDEELSQFELARKRRHEKDRK